jgi:hypothetical protein
VINDIKINSVRIPEDGWNLCDAIQHGHGLLHGGIVAAVARSTWATPDQINSARKELWEGISSRLRLEELIAYGFRKRNFSFKQISPAFFNNCIPNFDKDTVVLGNGLLYGGVRIYCPLITTK